MTGMMMGNGSTFLDGATVRGVPFSPEDGDSSYGVFELDGRRCGVFLEADDGPRKGHLRFCPGFQLPPGARDADKFYEWAWGRDDRMSEVVVDPTDGEVVFIQNDLPLGTVEDVGAAVADGIEFLLGDEFHEALVAYVVGRLGSTPGDGRGGRGHE